MINGNNCFFHKNTKTTQRGRLHTLETIVALSGIYHVTLDSLLLDQMPPISSDGSALPSPERDQLLSGYTDLSEPKRKEVLEFIEFKKQLPD